MPRSKNYSRDLPPAIITDQLLREINTAIPSVLRDDLTWSAKIPTTTSNASTVHEGDIETFIKATEDDTGFKQVALEAFSRDREIPFYLYCESAGSSLEYDCPAESEGELFALAHPIQDMFKEVQRWKHWVAIPLVPRSWVFKSPKFAIGK